MFLLSSMVYMHNNYRVLTAFLGVNSSNEILTTLFFGSKFCSYAEKVQIVLKVLIRRRNIFYYFQKPFLE